MKALLVCAGLVVPAVVRAQDPERLAMTAHTVSDSLVAFDGRRQGALRTTLTLRERISGRADTLSLEVVYWRLPARTGATGAPIVFLMGGPGVPASAMGRIPPYWTLFERLRALGDVILLDQRGTGESRPNVTCPAGAPPDRDFLLSLERLTDALVSASERCVRYWRERGQPPELFTAGAVAGDIEAIRRQLGVPRLSLLGFSFGSRLALEYLVRHPERVDRVVLQGTLGFADVVRLPTTLDSLLERVAAVAARDSTAVSLVPDLQAGLRERFAALDRQPYDAILVSPAGDSLRVPVGRGGLQAIVSGRVADARLPALVGSLAAGDGRVLSMLVGGLYRNLASGSLYGSAIYCSAPGPDDRRAAAARLAAGSLLGELFDNVPTSPDFCRRIGIPLGQPRAMPAVPTSARGLLITGTLDDRTPPANAAAARGFFADANLVLVEHGGHELLPQDDVQDLVVEFFATGAVSRDRVQLPTPRFASVAEALLPPRRR